MSEIQRSLDVIETEINFYKNQTATGIIEIGKRLIEAKAQLPHGEWGKWLEEKVDFTDRTAQRFMKVADEFPTSMSYLGTGKLFKLLDVPPDQRSDFINSNPIDEMTTRQLQEAIKAKKQADLKIEDLEQRLQSKPKQIEVPPADYRAIKAELEKLKTDLEMAEFKNQQLKRRMDEDNTPELFQQMSRKESEAQLKIIELNKKIDQLESDSKTIERKVKLTSVNFCARIHNFLESVGGMVWVNDYAENFTENEKQEYFKALDAVEAWAQNVRKNFKENEK